MRHYVEVSGTYDYLHNAPFFGVQVQTTAGVSSPANANGFSIRKTFATSQKGVALEAAPYTSLLFSAQLEHLRVYERDELSGYGYTTA